MTPEELDAALETRGRIPKLEERVSYLETLVEQLQDDLSEAQYSIRELNSKLGTVA
jgi:uncharacterized coiled-coil protein SlyX